MDADADGFLTLIQVGPVLWDQRVKRMKRMNGALLKGTDRRGCLCGDHFQIGAEMKPTVEFVPSAAVASKMDLDEFIKHYLAQINKYFTAKQHKHHSA